MYQALTLHNNVIRRAKYANCGATVQQEGDSYTLVRAACISMFDLHFDHGLLESGFIRQG
jgi:hypothetical protein